MADSGWLSFGTASSEVYNGTAAWGTPSNALTENDTFTSAGPIAKFESTDFLRLTNISGLDIPEGATVTGFDVRVLGKTQNGSFAMVPFVHLVLDGVRSPSYQTADNTLPDTPAYVSFTDYGQPRNWENFGLQYTPYTNEEMEGVGFGVDIYFYNFYFVSDTPSIDNVQIKVYWDLGGESSGGESSEESSGEESSTESSSEESSGESSGESSSEESSGEESSAEPSGEPSSEESSEESSGESSEASEESDLRRQANQPNRWVRLRRQIIRRIRG